MKHLDFDLLKRINEKVRKAEYHFLSQEYNEAIKAYKIAISMIPEPKHSWEESWTLYYGIAEMYFQKGNFSRALDYLKDCIKCPHAIGNPNVHLRIGQNRYELKQTDKAKDELMRAYMGGDIEIFKNEDKKYYNLIKEYINNKNT